jgi:hypothetical protein
MLGLLFDREDGGSMFLRNIELYGGAAQKMELVIVTAMRTSNPTKYLPPSYACKHTGIILHAMSFRAVHR